MSNISIDVRTNVFVSASIPWEDTSILPLDLWNILRCENVKWSLRRNTKNNRQKQPRILKINYKRILYKNSPVHNLTSKLCTGLFNSKIYIFRLIHLRARFVVPLNESTRRKVYMLSWNQYIACYSHKLTPA